MTFSIPLSVALAGLVFYIFYRNFKNLWPESIACPQCKTKDKVHKNGDEEKITFRCHCGHTWEKNWETPKINPRVN